MPDISGPGGRMSPKLKNCSLQRRVNWEAAISDLLIVTCNSEENCGQFNGKIENDKIILKKLHSSEKFTGIILEWYVRETD